MSIDWNRIILDTHSPEEVWKEIFSVLHDVAISGVSPVTLHDATTTPDRLLAEAAWDLWEAYPIAAVRTSQYLKTWAMGNTEKAVLILDALSLRELPIITGAAKARGIEPRKVAVTGSECPSSTDQFAKSIGLPSRSALAHDGKPATFALFAEGCYTDVLSLPFEDCTVPPVPRVLIWHSWLDDLIHLQNKLPDQIASMALSTLQSDDFWKFVDRMRQGRELVITSDHGYAVSKRFSSEVEDTEAIDILRTIFGASRHKAIAGAWQKRFMPPIAMTHNNQHVVVGQRKWKVQGGFPHVCHGGMSLLEVAVPYLEFPAL